MRAIECEVGESPRLELRLESGDVSIVTGEPGHMRVELSGAHEDEAEVTSDAHGIVVRDVPRERVTWVRRRRTDVRAVVPPGTRVTTASASGEVRASGRLSEVSVSTASGDVHLDEVDRLTAKAASGDIHVRTVHEGADVTVASGDVRLGEVRQRLDCTAASGDVAVRRAQGLVRVRSASGDVTIDRFLDGQLEVRTMAGDTTVGIPPRRKVSYELSSLGGSVHLPSDPAQDDDGPTEGTVRIHVKAVSGSLHLRRTD